MSVMNIPDGSLFVEVEDDTDGKLALAVLTPNATACGTLLSAWEINVGDDDLTTATLRH